MARSFRINTLSQTSAGEAVIDIPHLSVLRYASPQDLITAFERSWGHKPTSVVLPVSAPDGLNYQVEGLGEPLSEYASASNSLREFHDVAQAFAKEGLNIYLLLDPTLPFIRVAALQIVDISGDSSAQLCVGNSRTRDIAGAILGTGIDIVNKITNKLQGKLKGVVINACNLWPMGGSNHRLELTCFCPSCEEHFESVSPRLLKHFRDFPNPWNLVLKDNGSGIGFVSDIRISNTDEEIVGLSRQKGFHEIFDDQSLPNLREKAAHILEYIQLRHDQTMAAIADIFEQATEGLENQPTKVIIVEGDYYDWSAGLSLEALDSITLEKKSFDEVWFDPPSTSMALINVPFRSYMWKRSRYFVDAFFSSTYQMSDARMRATTGAGRLTVDQAKDLLRKRLETAVGSELTGKTSLVALPDLRKSGETSTSQRVGFVACALTREIGQQLINALRIPPGVADQARASGNARSNLRGLLDSLSGNTED